jgi:hypothetical protein
VVYRKSCHIDLIGPLFGDLSLEEAIDLSQDRQILELDMPTLYKKLKLNLISSLLQKYWHMA